MMMYVAVGKEFKDSVPTLNWVSNNNPTLNKLVFLHVHSPSPYIPLMGGNFKPSQVSTQQVNSHRQFEREKMDKTLVKYESFCLHEFTQKLEVERLVIEERDIAKGIIQLILENGITTLVMGAAADKNYSKKMKGPKSKAARTVQNEAHPSCKILFVCKGNLIFTRVPSSDGGYGQLASPVPCSSTTSISKSMSIYPEDSNNLRSFTRQTTSSGANFSIEMKDESQLIQKSKDTPQDSSTEFSRLNKERVGIENVEMEKLTVQQNEAHTPMMQEPILEDFLRRERDNAMAEAKVLQQKKEQSSCVFEKRENVGKLPDVESNKRNSVMSVLDANETEESDPLSSKHGNTMAKSESPSDLVQWEEPSPEEEDWNIHLQKVAARAARLMRGAQKESQMRSQAERVAYEANQRASALESSIAREIRLREEAQQSIANEKSKFENMKIQFQHVLQELQKIQNTNSTMKEKITESVDTIKTLEANLVAAETLIKSTQKERDNAIREVEKSSSINSSSKNRLSNFLEFSYEELEQATCRFENSLKIGEGGFGCVYRGYIRHTKVAIKVLNPESLQNQSDFLREVDNLSRLRHPNLLTLMGACPESLTLVYEFLSNGSLEDRLSCKDGTPPLSWKIRTRISAEICSSLIFLHSNKPSAVIHGDLRPANVLLDVNLVSKLSDFSISRLLIQSTASLYNWSDSKGMSVYVDPEFFSTGELRVHSDVYSFGIILLRLVTGLPALGIVKQVQEALEKGKLQEIIDISAGDWPCKEAHLIATLGLKCCEMKRRNRPDLVRDVLTILEPMRLSTFT